jgi:hypothetical protein
MKFEFATNLFPVFQPDGLDDLKDPCPVFDGERWHMFGSGGTVSTETWKIFHATAPALEGPWTQHAMIDPCLDGSGIAAPGVVFEHGVFHMFIQTEFMKSGGRCEHLVSNDGFVWVALPAALHSMPDSGEDGIYDPHPAAIKGDKYLVYSGMAKFVRVPQPDIYLARSVSGSWFGPWERLGKILGHEDLPHHNARGQTDYEWGIEGPQLVELPNGTIMLNATCFLPEGPRGTRQRVFFAFASDVRGPYRTVGPVLEPAGTGENGHSTVLVTGNEIVLFYQSRVADTNHRWRYGIARGNFTLPQAA